MSVSPTTDKSGEISEQGACTSPPRGIKPLGEVPEPACNGYRVDVDILRDSRVLLSGTMCTQIVPCPKRQRGLEEERGFLDTTGDPVSRLYVDHPD